MQQTNQDNEVERTNLLNTLKMNFDGQGTDISLTPELVRFYISSAKDTAPGPDGVRKAHLAQLDETSTDELTDVINTSLESGEIPID